MIGERVRIQVEPWLAKKESLSGRDLHGEIEHETNRAILLNGNWIPKSQITNVEVIETAPATLREKWGKVLIYVKNREEHQKLKRVPRAKYHAKEKAIGLPKTVEALKYVDEICPGAKWPDELRQWFDSKSSLRAVLDDIIDGEYSGKDQLASLGDDLYPYQRVGVFFAITAQRFILADEMGLGKTVQALTAIDRSSEDKDRTLVICPNTLKSNWANEAEQWTEGLEITVVRGDREERLEVLDNYDGGVLIVNYAMVRPENYLEELLDLDFDNLIVDEAHRIKNRKTEQTKGVHKLAHDADQYCMLLTGTPIMNRVQELWSLLHAVDPTKWSSFWRYAKEHANARPGKWGWVVDDHASNPEKLREEIKYNFLRRTKDEVMPDLPPKVKKCVWVDMEEEQEQIYLQMRDEAYVELAEQEYLTAPMVLSQITRLKQIAISPALIEKKGPSAKMERFEDLVYSIEGPVVVFSQWVGPLRLAEVRIPSDKSFASITGEVKEEDREQIIEDFNAGKIDVLLATLETVGLGANLVGASDVIFLDKHWTPAVNEQGVDRVHRHGQKETVHVYEILTSGTIEEYIEDMLMEKEDISASIVDHAQNIFNLDKS